MEEKNTGLFFTDLQKFEVSTEEAKEIDGMSAGTFTSMWGYEVKIDKLDKYVSNTKENLEGTKTEEGELVGLPIDAMGHNFGDAAGWIQDVRKDGDIVRFSVKWTDLGVDAIGRNIRRYFSPTIDSEKRVILGGSLTNWPATRTKKGKILLRPVVLSMPDGLQVIEGFEDANLQERMIGIFKRLFMKPLEEAVKTNPKLEEPMEEINLDNLTSEQLQKLQADWVAQFSEDPPDFLAEMIAEMAEVQANEKIALEKRKSHVAEFAARVCGGTKEKPIGLPVEVKRLEAFLTSLPEDQQTEAEELFSLIHDKKAVDFTEKGHKKPIQGLAKLPDEIAPLLRDWVGGGKTVARFFQENQAELGEMSAYDLSEFEPAD